MSDIRDVLLGIFLGFLQVFLVAELYVGVRSTLGETCHVQSTGGNPTDCDRGQVCRKVSAKITDYPFNENLYCLLPADTEH